jgi:hypothetical protein
LVVVAVVFEPDFGGDLIADASAATQAIRVQHFACRSQEYESGNCSSR